jgi:hypothetical protein
MDSEAKGSATGGSEAGEDDGTGTSTAAEPKAGEDNPDEDDEKKYMKDREVLDAELEMELENKPFQTFELFTGQKFGNFSGVSDYRSVGRFKGLVRVIEKEDEEPLFDSSTLLCPNDYMIRVYILMGLNIKPMDLGFNGRPGKSDPYVKIKLGKTKINDRKKYIDDTTDPMLFRSFELSTKLPGESQLTIELFDYDFIGGDDLIGRTRIDLEDRLFLQEWKDLGADAVKNDPSDKQRYALKPVERRGLFIPTSTKDQGTLEVWVDILTTSEHAQFPMLDISLPPPVKFEMRLVVWKAKDMVNMDEFEAMNDLYGAIRFCSLKEQTTDIHWRAKKGKGSFNWRMKFPVELGFGLEHTDFPRLTVQMWDKDIISFNECIAETVLDLKPQMKQAYKTKSRMQVFQDSDAKKAAREKKLKKKGVLPPDGDGKQSKGYKKMDGPPSLLQKLQFWKKKDDKAADAEGEGLMEEPVEDKPETEEEKAERRKKEKAESMATAGGDGDEAKEFVNSLKEMSGLFPE